MTIEELLNKPEEQLTRNELEILATHFKNESAKFTAYEQAVKVTLNSIYGAFGTSGSIFSILILLNPSHYKDKMQSFILQKF